MSTLTNFGKITKFQKFANSRMKNHTKCRFVLSYFEENIQINDFFTRRKNQIYIIFTYKRSKLFKNPKFSGKFRKFSKTITSEPNMIEM